MRSWIKKTYLLTILLVLVQCQTTVISLSVAEVGKDVPPTEKKRYGTVGFGYYDITKNYEPQCGQNTKEVIIRRDPVDAIIHFAINPFYTTRTIEIYCNK